MNKECMNVYKWVRIWYEIGGDVMAGMNKALRIGHFAHLKNLRDWATYWATNWRTDMTSCNNARRHIEIRCLDISSTFGHLCDIIDGYVYQAVGPAIQPFETLRACFLWHALIPVANALLAPTLEFQLSHKAVSEVSEPVNGASEWSKWAVRANKRSEWPGGLFKTRLCVTRNTP